MSILLTRQAVIYAKNETTYGSDIGPDHTNAILTTIPTLSFEVDQYERDITRTNLSPLPPRTTNIDVTVSFSCEIKGTNSSNKYFNTATQYYPEVDPLLRACGLESADLASAASDRVYTLKSDPADIDSCTIYIHWSGHKYIITGCIGNVSANVDQGGVGLYNFEFKGQFDSSKFTYNTALSSLSAPQYDTVLPPLCAGATFSFGGDSSLDASTVEWNLNNEISSVRSLSNDQATTDRFFIASRKPTCSFNPIVDKGATITPDYIALLSASTEVAGSLSIGTVDAGSDLYNKVLFDFSPGDSSSSDENKNVVTNVSMDDDNGVRRFGVEFQMNGSFAAGDDEFKITYKVS